MCPSKRASGHPPINQQAAIREPLVIDDHLGAHRRQLLARLGPRGDYFADTAVADRLVATPLRTFTYDCFVGGYPSCDRRVNAGNGCLRRGLSGPNSIRALHCERECTQHEGIRKIVI